MSSIDQLVLLVCSVKFTVKVFRLHPLEILFDLWLAHDLVFLYCSS